MPEPRLFNASFKPFPARNKYSFWFSLKWALVAFWFEVICGFVLISSDEMHIPEEMEIDYIKAKRRRIFRLEPDPSDFELYCLRVGNILSSFECVPKGKRIYQ
jgi:hypothetical protein